MTTNDEPPPPSRFEGETPDELPPWTELMYLASADELAVILALLGKGFTSYSNVFRVAIDNLAQQLGVDVPPDAFQLRSPRATRPASPKPPPRPPQNRP